MAREIFKGTKKISKENSRPTLTGERNLVPEKRFKFSALKKTSFTKMGVETPIPPTGYLPPT
jgi:hypothetical protein